MLLKRAYLIAFCTAILFSCKKEKDEPTIVGLWKGKYGGSTTYPTGGYAMLFRSNGTVRVYDGSDTTTATPAEGTYTISGDSLFCTYTYHGLMTYSAGGSVDRNMTFIEGTWGPEEDYTSSGRFFLNKQ